MSEMSVLSVVCGGSHQLVVAPLRNQNKISPYKLTNLTNLTNLTTPMNPRSQDNNG
jgi:hypothetical protein